MRYRKGCLTRGCYLCIIRGPFRGRKSLVTLRTHSGVKRSKKGLRIHEIVTHLNGKWDVSRTEMESHWASQFGMHCYLGPPIWAPEFEGPSHFLSLLNPAAHLTEIGHFSKPLHLTSVSSQCKNEGKNFLGSQVPLASRSGAPDATLRAIWAL